MAKTATANCDVCGKTLKRINRSHGLSLCSTCQGIMPGVSKHLPSLVKIIWATGKTGEVAEMLGLSAAGAARSEEARHNLEAVVQDARATLIKALPPAPENIDDTQSFFDIATLAEEAARHIDALTKDRDARQWENTELRQRLEQSSNADPLDDALLRWAKRQHQAGRVRVQMEVVEVEQW